MNIFLERFAYTPMGTFGRLKIDSWECYTVERPWLDNKGFISCIPEGQYILKKTKTPTRGNTFVIINNDIGVYEHDQGGGRYAILIHSGNNMDDLEGCIAPGDALGWVKSRRGDYPKWSVLNSRNTMREIRARIADNINDIFITEYMP